MKKTDPQRKHEPLDEIVDGPALLFGRENEPQALAITYLVVSLQHRIRQAFAQTFSAVGLNITQYAILEKLGRAETSTATEIAQWLSLRRQTLSTFIIDLEQRGLIERKPHPTHGRVLMLLLTETGSQLLSTCRQQAGQIAERMLKELSQDDLEHFEAYLRQSLTSML